MSSLGDLIKHFEDDDKVHLLQEKTSTDIPQVICTKGFIGASDSFYLAAAFQKYKRTHIYIADDKDSAAYVYSTLSSLLNEKNVLFFPDSFKRPLQYEELDKNNSLLRTETINKLYKSGDKSRIVITYPEAIFEKVVDPILLDKNKIDITKGYDLDVDTIIELLVMYGFERVEFVYQPGQFSIRGGIVDIFSYGHNLPYRVELFDTEVESIRTFNPETQLSEQTISSVVIIPNINSQFKQDQKITLFKNLTNDTLLWIKTPELLVDKLQICFEKSEAFAKTLSGYLDEELQEIFAERAFIYPHQIWDEITQFSLILQNDATENITVHHNIKFENQAQPSFNRNFNLLIENFNENTKNGYTNYLFTDSAKQIERFYNIFEDMGVQVQFHPLHLSVHEGFVDHDLKIACYTDHQIFERYHKSKLKQGFSQDIAISFKTLQELQPGDFVTHLDHGIGRYSGLETIEINGHKQETVRLIYQNNDILYVGINSLHKISRYVGKDGTEPKLNKIGGDAWKALKRKTKARVKDIAKELIKLYAQRKASKGYAFPIDGYLQTELEASFIYEDTPDQLTTTQDVKADMEKDYPMDRLICGDVGFGKTEIAIRAAFKAVTAGKQVALLVPTTILALQHFKTFSSRLSDFGVTVDFVNRFRTTKQKNEVYKLAAEGKVEILIGTHALLNKSLKFKDLGLLIIDEEQKFGVAAKEKLRSLQVNVDTLTMTATPIPRTLQFSLMAARDLSVIKTPPPNRQPIQTERRVFSDDVIREAIDFEIMRGGQVFFVHNRVKNLQDIADNIKKLCPQAEIAVAHGQLDPDKLEKTLVAFIEGKFDVLVCTNIIETGLDIANANTMIINNAHQFGMSDLHQLRGRVGRSNKKAYCYLFAPPLSVLTTDARKRLKTLEEFSDLGSGFQIAMRDMDIRGAGNLLGGEQSGFIADIGYETYHKILEEAITELKETDYKELFKDENDKKKEFIRDVDIDTDTEMLIPDSYVSNIQERLLLYTELDKLSSKQDIETFSKNLQDRFGKIPPQVYELFEGLRMRTNSKKLGFERIVLKNRKMNCYFVSNPQSAYFETDVFNNIMQYVAKEGHFKGLSIKQSRNYLILTKEGIKSLKQASDIIADLVNKVISYEVK